LSPFGENLRKIRNARGMSQEEFADLLGTSKQVISRYETAQRSPKVSTVAEYAAKLGVSIAELTGDPLSSMRSAFSLDGQAAQKLRELGAQLSPYSSDYDADRADLMKIYDGLNGRGRDALLNYARFLNTDPSMKEDGASNDTMA